MPLAAHITALPASASPTLLERAGAPVSATASTQKFGELFREQTGALPVAFPAPSPESAVTTAKSSEASAAPEPSHKTEASSLTEQAPTEQAESASATAIIPVSSRASSQIPSRSQSSSAANTEGNAVKTLAEASEVSLSALAAESKDTASPPQRTTISSPHKASENTQVSKSRNKESETPLAAAGLLVAQSALPAISSQIPPPAAQSATASSALGQTSTATNGNRGTSAVNIQTPTDDKDVEAGSSVPPQSGSAEDHSAIPLAQGTQQVTGNQTTSTASSVGGAASQQSAHAAAEGSASSKESPSAALPHSSVGPQNAHAAAEPTAGGAIATLFRSSRRSALDRHRISFSLAVEDGPTSRGRAVRIHKSSRKCCDKSLRKDRSGRSPGGAPLRSAARRGRRSRPRPGVGRNQDAEHSRAACRDSGYNLQPDSRHSCGAAAGNDAVPARARRKGRHARRATADAGRKFGQRPR